MFPTLIRRIFLIAWVTLAGTPALATTLQKLTFEEMVERSALIIQGEVVSVRPAESDNLLYTRVLFKVDDVLKGENPGEFIELDFLGGEESGARISVSGQDIPPKGERGFYFIENPDTRSVNPLTGWSQGHFRILTDPKGIETLETDIQVDIVEISDNKDAVLANKLRNMKFSRTLVDQAFYSPVTPDELRDAVHGFLDGE